jgi:putative SOS response-associated peptidase YedK
MQERWLQPPISPSHPHRVQLLFALLGPSRRPAGRPCEQSPALRTPSNFPTSTQARARTWDRVQRLAIWREWDGDRGTKKAPNVRRHKLYSFLTTAPNGTVEPVHNKAMPVLLMTPTDVERWLEGTAEEALELQKPAPEEAIIIDPTLEKKAA